MESPNDRFRFSFFLLVIVIVLLPLSVTKFFASYSDLPKASFLIALGGFFVASVIISLLLCFRGNYSELKINLITFDVLVFIFLISLVLSTIFSINPEISYHGSYQRQTGLKIFLYGILIYFAVSAVLSQNRIPRLVLAMEVTGVIVSFYAIFQSLSVDPFSIQPANHIRPVSTLGNAIFLGGFLVIVLPFSVLNISRKSNKILIYLFPSVIAAGIILSGTRSAYVAVAAQLIFATVLVFFNKAWFRVNFRKILISVTIISAVIITILILWHDFYYGRIYSLFNFSENPRLLIWRDSLPVFLKYPLTGCGLAMFPRAFEEFYSFELRLAESTKYFDHPHNNFLYYLYSCGITGFAAYSMNLLYVLWYSVKNFSHRVNTEFNLAMALFATGYITYGLTNFDDIAIIFYTFVLFGLFRYVHNKTLIQFKGGFILTVLSSAILIVYVINLFDVYNDLKSDRYYKLALTQIKENKFSDAVNNLNNAINLNPRNAVYRFDLIAYSYLIASTVYGESRLYLLEQIKSEIERARKNYISALECDEILSMVYYESGNTSSADSMKSIILSKDPVNINYRIHLARFYLRNYYFAEVKKQLDMIFTYSPENLEACYVAVRYYDLIKDTENLHKYCNIILKKNPDDEYIREVMKMYMPDSFR